MDSRDRPRDLESRKINCTSRGLNCGPSSHYPDCCWVREAETAGEGGMVMGVILCKHLRSHHQHAAHDAGLVIVSAFRWTKGKEDAAFALACLDFLPPLASLHERISSFALSYRLQHLHPHFIRQQSSQVRHTPFIHRILAEKNSFFCIFLLHPRCPFVCPFLTFISFLPFFLF